MQKLIRQHWWKALGVLILIYVFIAGMLIPLKPGITLVNPSSTRTNTEVVVEVEGYNTNFDQAGESIRMWLKMDDERSIAAQQIEVLGPTKAKAAFRIPIGKMASPRGSIRCSRALPSCSRISNPG